MVNNGHNGCLLGGTSESQKNVNVVLSLLRMLKAKGCSIAVKTMSENLCSRGQMSFDVSMKACSSKDVQDHPRNVSDGRLEKDMIMRRKRQEHGEVIESVVPHE